MELEKVFTELWQNLYKPFVFYIPKSFMPELDGNKALNTAVLIDRQGFDSEIKDQLCNHIILGKSMVLNENIFKLIDLNERLKEKQFQFFLEKYLEHVNFVVYISDWMDKHVEQDMNGLKLDTIQAFESQFNVFKQHVEDLRTHIIIPDQVISSKPVNVSEFIETDLLDIKKALNINEDSSNEIPKKVIKEVSLKTKKILPRLTDEEAEIFLLETIFNAKEK
jgi:hypothetical protein